MNDFLNKSLEIGDEIVACVPHGRNSGASLVKGIVIGFTNTMVRASIPSYNVKEPENRLIHPKKIVRYIS